MHLLYLDDSGSAKNSQEDYLVLGGVSVSEPQIHWVTTQLDRIAEGIDPANPHNVEFHASEIFARRAAPWKGMSRDEARGVIRSVLQVLADSFESARAFACVVHKASFPGRDPMEVAFEDVCRRFDLYLSRLRANGDRHRGLLILDESAHETTLQALARDFRTLGTRWGNIRNLVETPLFVDSRASRVVQLADHVAYATFRRYQAGDTQYFDLFANRFDAADGIIHGLKHLEPSKRKCVCLGCYSRGAAPND